LLGIKNLLLGALKALLRMQSQEEANKEDKKNLRIYYCFSPDVLIQESSLCRFGQTITTLQM
jgi:hypothetical protein